MSRDPAHSDHRRRLAGSLPGLAAALAVALALGGLLVGYEPVGGDPDTMYRPIKAELARALARGHLPYWSDRFGLGVPLVAESHVAAFYPPNWLLYRVLDVSTAYRLAMWLHHVALAAATYAYARQLGSQPWGAALAAVSLTLCGFQAAHAAHEPFYHAMPYLILAVSLGQRYVEVGGAWRLAGLALAWGWQIALGHFQIALWTGGLVLFLGAWQARGQGRSAWLRGLGLAGGLAWGAAVAAAQLALTSELRSVAGFDRPARFLMNYSFPPAHWAQPALPRLFLGLAGGTEGPYWGHQQTTNSEACLYVGTVPLVLACVGLVASRRERAFAPWKVIAVLGFVLATMPRWWPEGFQALLVLPGLGYFRAPGRYTLLTSLGMALLAGRGLDRTLSGRSFAAGLALAVAFGAAAVGWTYSWAHRTELLQELAGEPGLTRRLAEAGVAWAVALAAVVAWRRRWLGGGAPVAVAAVELALLFYQGPTAWGWSVALPAESPLLRRLMDKPGVGLIAGPVKNIPVRVGLTPAFPYLGITPPPPNYLLEAAESPSRSVEPASRRWLARFGVTHGLWDSSLSAGLGQTIATGPDPALDRLIPRPHGSTGPISWRLVRYPDAAPAAHLALQARVASRWEELYPRLSQTHRLDEVWFLKGDEPADRSPRARKATLRRWNGRSGEVEHDGACDLVLRRTFYPGWTACVDDGPERPVLKADGGLQAIHLSGAGVSRVTVQYRPTALAWSLPLTLGATLAAIVVLLVSAGQRARGRAVSRSL